MGALTPIDKVYYPDKTDIDQPNVYLATMAQSIEDGIGARLRQQEVAVGLKAGIAPGTGIPVNDVIAPFTIRSDNGGFNEGFDLAGGIATVKTKGLYIIAASAGINPSENIPANVSRTVSVTVYKGTTPLAGAEVLSSVNYYQSAAATTVISCVPGDTLHIKWHSAGPWGVTGNAQMANSSVLTYLSIALVQALPA